jgi:hypothetical protein
LVGNTACPDRLRLLFLLEAPLAEELLAEPDLRHYVALLRRCPLPAAECRSTLGAPKFDRCSERLALVDPPAELPLGEIYRGAHLFEGAAHGRQIED